MTFVQHTPAPPLGDAVASIWDWRMPPGAFRLERRLPTLGAMLIVNLFEDASRVYADDEERACERSTGTVLGGQPTRSFLIDTTEQVQVMGVALRPGGAACFFREPMDRLSDRHVALEDLGADAAALRDRLLHAAGAAQRIALLEAWLVARFRPQALHPAVAFALRALQASPQVARIDALVEASGYSARRFGALFRAQAGVGAKRFARLARFRAAVDLAAHGRRIDWTRIAADCGFHDQPHLVREFRAFAGMTPGAYLRLRGPHVNHVALP
jgi:AraC-like DNA-binding protein